MKPIDQLLSIMTRLRDRDSGCPWDVEQTFATIAPYTIEEAYEVADAIEQNDMAALRDELGDLLFQVVFHSQMASEAGHFDFNDVANGISDKMLRRHPHVFSQADGRTAHQQTAAWEDVKQDERSAKGHTRVLDGVARALPPMKRALKLQNRAARVGFDWAEPGEVLNKLSEEAVEIRQEIDAAAPLDRLEDEVGDLMFVCVNLARKLNIDPEQALNRANSKFTRRFNHIEDSLKAAGKTFAEADLQVMEDSWNDAKRIEKTKETAR